MTSSPEVLVQKTGMAALPTFAPVVVALLVAAGVRLAAALLLSGAIDSEGAEYARIAQNLLAGAGYTGMATPGQQLFFPPLFPYLIAGLSLVVGDAETAGRIVSLVAGSLLVLPVYAISLRLYGQKAAVIAGWLTALHPVLIYYSTTVYCEPLFLSLIATAIYLSTRAADNPTAGNASLSGMAYGLAYLVRPEALTFAVIAVGVIVLARRLDGRNVPWRRLSLLPLVALIVTAPYITWLSFQTGGLRLEIKSALNLATAARIQQGMPSDQATLGIAHDLATEGTYIQPNISAIRDFSLRSDAFAQLLIRQSEEMINGATSILAGGPATGSPMLFALAVLGLFARAWRRSTIPHHLHLVCIGALSIAGTLFIYYQNIRFYLLPLVFMCIWASFGSLVVGNWASGTARAVLDRAAVAASAASVARALVLLGVILPSSVWAIRAFSSDVASRAIQHAGEQLAEQTSIEIADTSTVLAFHARAPFVWLPYSDGETALRFLRKEGVTHVVVDEAFTETRPYLRDWVEHGVPGGVSVASFDPEPGRTVGIFKLLPENEAVDE